MRTAKLLFCLIFIVIVHGAIAWSLNRPQDAGVDVPSGKLRSLSFAPYREGFSPIEEKFPLPEHIDADLGLVADKTHSIRTYSILGGMQPTPEFARKHGVEMIQGGWLGDGHASNKLEIAALIESVNANPDVVKRVLVGNEVLLRKDMDVDTLIGYIRQVKQAVKQPVSYADVWSIYLKYPQLMQEVDFITVHILPYWEDEPVAIEDAAGHVEKIVKQIEDKAHSMGINKPILIGESGWPAAGRQRGQAIPSVVNETRFIRSLIEVVNRHGLDYNIVEAFNQPWKSHNEGVVGANWGLLTIDREPVFPLTGPVYENPDWLLNFAWATGLWLLLVAIYFKKLPNLSLPRLVGFLTLAQIFGVCLVTLADFLWFTSYSIWQQAYTVLLVAANGLLSGLLMQRCYAILANQPALPVLANRLRSAYLFFAVLALYKTYSLAFNGRYLSFPVEQFAIPAIGVCGLIACLWLAQRQLHWHMLRFDSLSGGDSQTPRDRLLAYFLSFGILAVVIGETHEFMAAYDFIQAHPNFSEGLPVALNYTLYNRQLLNWLLCILVLSIPFWASRSGNAKA
ncbi:MULTISPECIES: exo-beta-1,3-glucanase [Methylomonas]|uniref:Endo-1,3-beta-glucanase btgC n=2 Tax=Methylomonas TaxID=416 RepID=A0A126T219_9GAMM|nr:MULTISPECIES: exo-beta-1,3-glucanase [Methylomonas]AMK76118.1 exo-beta-1,3-glucanase [Methylomonas denitrificans]OAH96095.1 exo-beta-1,3-glucanase [Methylomonas methanica]TCV81385.1 exo-beta-1,3-glucanase (GH17 family) [Methylomonas methanica]